MPPETPLEAANRRIAEILRLMAKLEGRCAELRQVAERGIWTDDLAHIEHRLRELIGEEG